MEKSDNRWKILSLVLGGSLLLVGGVMGGLLLGGETGNKGSGVPGTEAERPDATDESVETEPVEMDLVQQREVLDTLAEDYVFYCLANGQGGLGSIHAGNPSEGEKLARIVDIALGGNDPVPILEMTHPGTISFANLLALCGDNPDIVRGIVDWALDWHAINDFELGNDVAAKQIRGVQVLDTGVIYRATADRSPCNFGEVFTTDGRVAALDLVVLEDDQNFFPLYNVSPVFREDVHRKFGDALEALYAPITDALDDDTMASLNARVSADGEPEAEVAMDFLDSNGLLADGDELSGAEITVGSKDFDEQLVLGEISVALLESAGATVNNEVNLGGTHAARSALVNGDIDHYWEYTGTAWISLFGETDPIPDRVEQYEAVAEREAAREGLIWLEPSQFNNTYGIAMSREAHDELGVNTISEMGGLIESDPGAVSLCVESEFNVRDDGLPGMEAHYGFKIPRS